MKIILKPWIVKTVTRTNAPPRSDWNRHNALTGRRVATVTPIYNLCEPAWIYYIDMEGRWSKEFKSEKIAMRCCDATLRRRGYYLLKDNRMSVMA